MSDVDKELAEIFRAWLVAVLAAWPENGDVIVQNVLALMPNQKFPETPEEWDAFDEAEVAYIAKLSRDERKAYAMYRVAIAKKEKWLHEQKKSIYQAAWEVMLRSLIAWIQSGATV